VTTKFVQIKTLGKKLALPRGGGGVIVFPYILCSKNLKNLLRAGAKIFIMIHLQMFIMIHLQMGVYQVCSNKSPWVKIGPAPVAYIQVSDFRAIMALLLCF
jgi:hypothetical protein